MMLRCLGHPGGAWAGAGFGVTTRRVPFFPQFLARKTGR